MTKGAPVKRNLSHTLTASSKAGPLAPHAIKPALLEPKGRWNHCQDSLNFGRGVIVLIEQF
jgi:hypothetical protein